MNPADPARVSQILSSSIAPVTLITGVAFLTSIMAPRFGRCIDRIRVLLHRLAQISAKDGEYESCRAQLNILYRRTRILKNTMTAAGVCILCVVLTIITTFSHLFFGVPGPGVAITTFIAALIWLGLLTIGFIYDFFSSLQAVRLEIDYALNRTQQMEPVSIHKKFTTESQAL